MKQTVVALPQSISVALQSKGRLDLVKLYSRIERCSPSDFIARFSEQDFQYLAGGMFGLVYWDETTARVMKFAHPIFASQDRIQLDANRSSSQFLPPKKEIAHAWSELIQHSRLRECPLYSEHSGLRWGGIPVREEIYGALLWAMYTDLAAVEWGRLSDDGLAYERPYWRGHTLADLLKSEREKTALYQEYEGQYQLIQGRAPFNQSIWHQVVHWQRLSEVMLKDWGVTIDLLSPRNFRVVASGCGEIQLRPFDHGLVMPSLEALDYYRVMRGIHIPAPHFQDAIGSYTVWPLVPEHIVTGTVWDLSFEQALQYLQMVDDSSESQALKRLAALPRWKIETAPFVENFANIDRAQARTR